MPTASSDIDTDIVRRRYDRGAACYDWLTWPMEKMAMDRFRGRLIGQVIGPRVLEVGVGTGRNLPLYRPGPHIDAIDFSPRMLERARQKPLPPNITLHLMDVQDLQFPPGSFDSVVATCVFCSVPDPVRGLSEIRRVLRPGGRALFLEHVGPARHGSPPCSSGWIRWCRVQARTSTARRWTASRPPVSRLNARRIWCLTC